MLPDDLVDLTRRPEPGPHGITTLIDGEQVETPADLPPLRDRLLFVGLNPSPDDERLVTRLLEHPSDLQPATGRNERGAGVEAPPPVSLITLALAAAASLALLLALSERLRWEEA